MDAVTNQAWLPEGSSPDWQMYRLHVEIPPGAAVLSVMPTLSDATGMIDFDDIMVTPISE
jgi:hypothetical protein